MSKMLLRAGAIVLLALITGAAANPEKVAQLCCGIPVPTCPGPGCPADK
jgi:hypothetical protein